MQNPKIVLVGGENRYDIRAFFRKEGRAKYISHLDLYRTVQRAFNRSKLPVWFTDGFNPKIYLNFAMPISLGFEGKEEAFDFRLNEDMDEQVIVDTLNGVMPEGIVITRVQSPVKKVKDIATSVYSLKIAAPGVSDEELVVKLREYFAQSEIITEKRTKKGMKELDIRPMIGDVSFVSESPVTLRMSLPSGVAVNLNPTLVMDTFAKQHGISLDYLNICREKILCEDGTEFY